MIFRDISPKSRAEKSDIKILSEGGKNSEKQKALYVFAKKKKAKRKPEISIVLDEKIRSGTKITKELIILGGFALMILLIINLINLIQNGLHLKNNIVTAASAGYEQILSAANELKEMQFENAKNLFNNASEAFSNIQNSVWFVSPKIPALDVRDPLFESANAVIVAGKHLALAGLNFTDTAKNLQSLPRDFFSKNSQFADIESGLNVRPSLTQKLKEELPKIEQATANLTVANEEIHKIPSTFIPPDLRDKFSFAKDALNALTDFMSGIQKDLPAILKLLGDENPHTYLILLQNNAELRPTGGFIGSLIVMETRKGYLTKSEFSDVYAFDHKLTENVRPPEELSSLADRWYLRDSNYNPDFPISAQKAAWFLEKEGGPGVDTVIAIDQSVITKLLRLTGPISIPELSQPVTEDNFPIIMSYVVEAKLFGRENPKAVLGGFMTAFEHALLSRIEPVSVMPVIKSAIESKNILTYSSDHEVQDFFDRHAISGRLKNLDDHEDFLTISHTSIGGNKSDEYVEEIINHDTFLKSDGSVVNELNITRSHKWNNNSLEKIRNIINSFGYKELPEKLIKIMGGSDSIHAIRIYVPPGSTLEEDQDPGISTHFDNETGKTYFSALMVVSPGDSTSLKVRYRLPFKLNLDPVDKYFFSVQKQAGQENILLRKRIFPESGIVNYKYFPEESSFDIDGVLNYENELNKDMSFSSIWGK